MAKSEKITADTPIFYFFRCLYFFQGTIICYQLTCHQPHFLSPHLLSIHMPSASLPIPSFAINSHAISLTSYPLICYQLTCNQPHFLSPHLLSIHSLSVSLVLGLIYALATLANKPQLLSGQFTIRPHLLSKHLFSSLTAINAHLLY